MAPVKYCEGSEISPYLNAKKITCYNFMDADKRYDTPWSKVKESLLPTAITVATASAFLFWFPKPQFLQSD